MKIKKFFIVLASVCLIFCVSGCTTGKKTTTTNTYNYGATNKTCQFTNTNGVKCTSKATHGSFCEYHWSLLDNTYHQYAGN